MNIHENKIRDTVIFVGDITIIFDYHGLQIIEDSMVVPMKTTGEWL